MGAAESKSPSLSKRGSSDSALKFGQPPETRRSNPDDFFLPGGPGNSMAHHRSGHSSSPLSYTGKGTSSTSKPTSVGSSVVPTTTIQKPSTEEIIVKSESLSTRPLYPNLSSSAMSCSSAPSLQQSGPTTLHGSEFVLLGPNHDRSSNAGIPSKHPSPFSNATSCRPSAPSLYTESSVAIGNSGVRSGVSQSGPSVQPSHEQFSRYGKEGSVGDPSTNELPHGNQLFSVGTPSSNFSKQPPQQKAVHHRHVDLKVYTPLQGTSDAFFISERGQRGGRSRASHEKGHRGRGESKRGGFRGREDSARGGFRGIRDVDNGFRVRADGNGEEPRERDHSARGRFRGRGDGDRGFRFRGDGDRAFRGRGDDNFGAGEEPRGRDDIPSGVFRGRGDDHRGGRRERRRGRGAETGSVEQTLGGNEYYSHQQKSSNERSNHRGMNRGNHRGRWHNGRRGGRGSHRPGHTVDSSSANDKVGGNEIANGASNRTFECPICMEDLVPPIYQCQNGHLVCNNCEKLIDKCAECREAMPENKIRNRAIEDLVSSMTNLET